jgi:hypothetical protein
MKLWRNNKADARWESPDENVVAGFLASKWAA